MKGWSRVREPLSPIVVGEALVSLLEPLHPEIGGADVRRRRLRLVADGEAEPADRERVGERRRLEVGVQAAVEVGSGRAVHRPAPGPVGLEDRLAPPARRPPGDACAPGAHAPSSSTSYSTAQATPSSTAAVLPAIR